MEAASLEEALRADGNGVVVEQRAIQNGSVRGDLAGYLCQELGFMPSPPTAVELGNA